MNFGMKGKSSFKHSPPLTDYHWRGLNAHGKFVDGRILALNKTIAKVLLHQQGVQVKTLSRAHFIFAYFRQAIKPEDIVRFTRQMAILLNAQIPLTQAFDALKRGNTQQHIQILLEHIKLDIQRGLSFANALRKHPRHFNALMCNLIDAGEQSGSLSLLMMKLALHQEQTLKIRKKIQATFIYPGIIVCLAVLITLGLLIFVVPEFASLFNQFGAELPWFTRLFIYTSIAIKSHGTLYLIAIMISIFACRTLYKHAPTVLKYIDTYLLKIPVFGQILEESIIARLMHTLSLILTAGLPLMDALSMIEPIAGNYAYARAISTIREHVRQGLTLEQAIRLSKRFPNMMIQMVAIGEESGKLEAMLAQIAKQYDDMFFNSAELWGRLLEPFLMATLGIIIGTLIIAMYLPIFQLGAIV